MLSLITGVARTGQLGETVAMALAERGDTVLLVSREATQAAAIAAALTRAGSNAHGYGSDLADPASVSSLAGRIREEHGDRLDALVNLAGGFAFSGPLADSDPAVLERQLRINLTTAYLTTRAFLPLLRAARGSIVFFASEAVLDGSGTTGLSAYIAAKAAVLALMRSVADEALDSGVRANAIAPAAIRTGDNETAMGRGARFVEREDVASAVAFLCSPASGAITGQTIRLR